MSEPPLTRAARVRPDAPDRFAVEEAEAAEPGAGEVRLRVEACGICGTDLHLYHAGLLPEGHTPGHEMAGTVELCGPAVDGLAVGDRVAVEPLASCGECAACRAGRENVCRSMQLYGVHRPGGFAERVVVPARRCFALPADLDPALGALAEPVAVAVHGLRRGALEEGQRVLVLGAGAVGLVTLVAARALGAGEVWISARYPAQAERARRLGAARVLGEDEADAAALARLGRDRDVDLVVETVGGRADTLRAAAAAIRPGGTVSVLGVFMGPVELDPYPLLLKEGTLAWSNCYDRCGSGPVDFARAARLVSEERERLESLVSHRLPLDRIGEAFRTASDKGAGAVKVSVTPAARAA